VFCFSGAKIHIINKNSNSGQKKRTGLYQIEVVCVTKSKAKKTTHRAFMKIGQKDLANLTKKSIFAA